MRRFFLANPRKYQLFFVTLHHNNKQHGIAFFDVVFVLFQDFCILFWQWRKVIFVAI